MGDLWRGQWMLAALSAALVVVLVTLVVSAEWWVRLMQARTDAALAGRDAWKAQMELQARMTTGILGPLADGNHDRPH